MRNNKHLATFSAAVMAVITLVGTSAFADSRPANETGEGRVMAGRERAAGRMEVSRGDISSNATRQAAVERRSADHGSPSAADRNGGSRSFDRDTASSAQGRAEVSNGDSSARSYDRNRSNDNRSYDRNRPNDNHSYDRNRSGDNRSYDRNNRNGNYGSADRNRSNDSRHDGNWRGGDNRSYGHGGGSYRNRQRYSYSGRISNIAHYGSGYRIWLGGAPYPFFVSDSYYRRNRFRIGVSIALGGYYNPLGYYDYDDGYYDGGAYSTGALRGVVESVDFRRDTFVIRNEATGSYVTVASRSRRDDYVRPGDYVEIAGNWTRSGFFEAYDVSLLHDGYRDGYRR
ncbi:MAG: hypothetical protein ABI837_08250 [Acidobacteriota bacterium]